MEMGHRERRSEEQRDFELLYEKTSEGSSERSDVRSDRCERCSRTE